MPRRFSSANPDRCWRFSLFGGLSTAALAAEAAHAATRAPYSPAQARCPFQSRPVGRHKFDGGDLDRRRRNHLVCAQLATRKIKPVPTGLQNFWEWLVESLYNFLENMIGRDLVKKTFWFFATIFIFILFLNWFGLIPGRRHHRMGTSRSGDGAFTSTGPCSAGPTPNLNLTFAMACVFFVCWIVWALQANGVGGVIKHLFGAQRRHLRAS